jgi:hypothetical protein
LGCADSADVFPENSAARQIGSPRIDFVREGIDRGPVTATMPDGEVLTGTYRVNRSGFLGAGFAGAHAVSVMGVGDGGVQFVARGPRTALLCRGTTGIGGHGSGECETEEGALWAVSW